MCLIGMRIAYLSNGRGLNDRCDLVLVYCSQLVQGRLGAKLILEVNVM